MTLLLVENGCPNCGGSISADRLEKGLPCYRCLPKPTNDVCRRVKKRFLKEFCETDEKLSDFVSFFERALGSSPWSLQKLWAKRVFKGYSFAMVAPTGVGKTTFGLIMSLYLDGKILLVFPTRILADQAGNRLKEISEKLNLNKRILVYESKKKVKEQFIQGDYDILCGTNMFLHRNFETLYRFKFSFVFVDDIDSFLKSSRNVDNLFKLLGFSEDEIRLALKESKTQEDWEKLERIRRRKRDTVLLISSATLKPKSKRIMLFRNLLGFDVQKASISVRNVIDAFKEAGSFEEALDYSIELIKKLGKGGLVFVPSEELDRVVETYRKEGFRTVSYTEYSPKELYSILEKGEFDVAVGIAHINNPLVRGLDLPHIVRYALFIDVPKHEIPLKPTLKPSGLYTLILSIMKLLTEEEKAKAMEYVSYLRKYLNMTEEALEKYPRIKQRLMEISNFVRSKVEDETFISKLESSEDISLVRREEGLFLIVGDASTYIQASGRTSRFIAGGMTKGLSIILFWDRKAFNSLRRRLATGFMQADVEFKDLERIDLESIMREIDEDRARAREILQGKAVEHVKDLFRTTLVVVESPNKARTIASFFGKPQLRMLNGSILYEIPLGERLLLIGASLGHVLDLVVDRGFFGVIEEHDSFIPVYTTIKRCKSTGEQHTDISYLKSRCNGEIEDKIELVNALRNANYEVDEVFIATDPDAEGEKIAYDLFLLFRSFNPNIKRMEFHEITPKAFRTAMEQKQDFDINRVKSQIVRRVLDRWVGFTLSRILWKRFGKNYLSAGRVQTPVLGWIIERYELSKRRKARISFKLGGIVFRIDIEDKELAKEIYKDLHLLRLNFKQKRTEERTPLPPYTTDTILQDASEVLGFSAQKTMSILQNLFEEGFITYHRTDSTRVSDAGKFMVAKPYILERFGEGYFQPRTWGEGGAHECIRPTRNIDPDEFRFMIGANLAELKDPYDALKLYSLIFRRFIASQMRNAKVVVEKLVLELPYWDYETEVVSEVLEDGYNLMFSNFKLFNKSKLSLEDPQYKEVPFAPLYTQGTLIQEMKRRGLGRPSTYAHIVQTLLERKYVIEKNGKLIPTSMGIKIYEYLRSNYPDYTSEELTRKLEEAMDNIEQGKIDYMEVLREAYRVKELLPT